jgi:hypothetical protein
LITPILYGEEYKLIRSSLCNFLNPSAISSLLCQIFSAPCSHTPSIYIFL